MPKRKIKIKPACDTCFMREYDNSEDERLLSLACDKIHKTWHTLTRYLQQWYYRTANGTKKDFTPSKRKYRYYDPNEVHGYPAISRIERFKRLFGGIEIVRCDDSAHCGSIIVLVPHETDKKYWGTTIMSVPQCTSTKGEMFLYPNHLDNLIKSLLELQKRQKEKNLDDNDI